MKPDPFGNLTDWAPVIDHFEELANGGQLENIQPGIIRILRFKGNWRLREVVLKRLGEIKVPSKKLIFAVLAILTDDNVYYDARVIAGDTLCDLLQNGQPGHCDEFITLVRKAVEKLKTNIQPPFFDDTLSRLCRAAESRTVLEN
ncbi:conserved hypothetical protein [Desulfosarcina cetonica]|uniref:hypothetical protein n=1 Tax=Desulfosarcina cetonica TaxID=90730 RepID=UPI0006CFB2CB|nr:hypothetical protein [Desulfosarcina cetonica]VTR68291.1 conserved hypothetical protein [Desulfosarcina cetonica]